MATKTPPPLALNAKQQIALRIAAAFYAGPSGHALLNKEDGDVMAIVVDRAFEFADIFLGHAS